jgi:hypothetical protein
MVSLIEILREKEEQTKAQEIWRIFQEVARFEKNPRFRRRLTLLKKQMIRVLADEELMAEQIKEKALIEIRYKPFEKIATKMLKRKKPISIKKMLEIVKHAENLLKKWQRTKKTAKPGCVRLRHNTCW